jgi:hypothetical protein
MRSANTETLCTSSTYSRVFHTDLKINSDYVNPEVELDNSKLELDASNLTCFK